MSKNDDLVRRELTIAELQTAHIDRQEEWCPEQKPDLSFRGNEMAGEVGEACNVIKKLERERQGWRGSRATKAELSEELADVVHTAVLCAITAGIELQAAIVDKFNATSEKNGLSTMLSDALERGAAQGVVTDAMVERAAEAARDHIEIDGDNDGPFIRFDSIENAMRAALETVFSATPPAPAPDAGEEPDTEELLTIAYMMGAHSAKGPTLQPSVVEAEYLRETLSWVRRNIDGDTRRAKEQIDLALGHIVAALSAEQKQPPAVEVEAVERFAQYRENMIGTPAGTWVRFTDLEAALKAKTDEIERLRRERDRYRRLHQASIRAVKRLRERAEAAEASNKALREGLEWALAYIDGTTMADLRDSARALLSEQGA